MRSLESIVSNNLKRQAAYDAAKRRGTSDEHTVNGSRHAGRRASCRSCARIGRTGDMDVLDNDVTGSRFEPAKPVVIQHDLTAYYKRHPFDGGE